MTRPTTVGASKRAAILAALNTAADEGRVCPSNDELAVLVQVRGAATASDAVKALERDGLIVVERFSAGRMVTIVATGRSTRWDGARNPHWRGRPARVFAGTEAGKQSLQQADRVLASSAGVATIEDELAITAAKRRVAQSLGTVKRPIPLDRPAAPRADAVPGDRRPPAWDRGPCPRCATRGDLGCAHQRPFEEAAA